MGLRGPRRRSYLPVGLTLILLGLTAATATHAGTTGLSSAGVMASVGMTASAPTMGWNSWNSFGCGGLTETLVRETADAMVNGGPLAAGVGTVDPRAFSVAGSPQKPRQPPNEPGEIPGGGEGTAR